MPYPPQENVEEPSADASKDKKVAGRTYNVRMWFRPTYFRYQEKIAIVIGFESKLAYEFEKEIGGGRMSDMVLWKANEWHLAVHDMEDTLWDAGNHEEWPADGNICFVFRRAHYPDTAAVIAANKAASAQTVDAHAK
jgi:hypothetical protein